ncbi:hypothetical protein TIFTF001_007806 [Ficus carica]|uniref:Uncharacterized protein n=1 Tax=Ficus carica TaxID=3494 RepID=A0AA88DGN1_FICCA|nr:hypothetical protein TIFTF001_007806 [Ficus carica]
MVESRPAEIGDERENEGEVERERTRKNGGRGHGEEDGFRGRD